LAEKSRKRCKSTANNWNEKKNLENAGINRKGQDRAAKDRKMLDTTEKS
jgi:hypothetical protein